eukprot:7532311-Pyramimonas_sp.AAC.1
MWRYRCRKTVLAGNLRWPQARPTLGGSARSQGNRRSCAWACPSRRKTCTWGMTPYDLGRGCSASGGRPTRTLTETQHSPPDLGNEAASGHQRWAPGEGHPIKHSRES